MGDKSSIEWTDATWNPFTGCTKVSPGCDHCYMFRQYPRLKGMGVKGYETGPDQPQFIADRLAQPSKWQRPRMIFVNSMSDTFHSAFSNEQIAQVFDAMIAAPQHTYQVLTKRPNRVRKWWEWYRSERESVQHPGPTYYDEATQIATYTGTVEWKRLDWPANIWLGTSVESALYLPRIDRIAGIAPVTFLSAEPLLDSLLPVEGRTLYDYCAEGKLQWVIVGGESGPGFRPVQEIWVRYVESICGAWGVPFFFKQWGGLTAKSAGRELYGRTYDEMPVQP